jgi:hypothetical protein
MKEIKLKKLFAFLMVAMTMASCLKEGAKNIDTENPTGSIVTLQFIENGSGSTINSGMQYFSGGALTYPGSHESDTATFNVNLAGPTTLTSDLTVTVGFDATKVLDNIKGDAIDYTLMPDSLYKFMSKTAVIKAGQRVATLKIVFYPSKIDVTKSYNLPVVIKDAGGKTISGNFGVIHFHVIGNPIAGAYNWDFIRRNNQAGTGGPSGGSFSGEHTIFSPVNPTSVKTATGYYVQPNYLISFKNTSGVLSNFKAQIAPDEIEGAFTNNGITVVTQPVITVSSDYKSFTINYVVFNGAAYRNCWDYYTK